MKNSVKLSADSSKAEEWEPKEVWRIYKNIILIGIAFTVQFTAVHGVSNLQSSINADAGLGTASLAAEYIGVIISSLFLPVIIIKWLGTKWTMTLGFLVYIPYILAQLWPSFYSLVPTGLVLGLAGAPVWCAMCTYMATVSKVHSKISKIPDDVLLARFLGLFFMVFHVNEVGGNLISSLVLLTEDNEAARTSLNESMIPELCGANFLPSDDGGRSLRMQPPEKIQMLVVTRILHIICFMGMIGFWLLSGIYLACMVGATALISVCVDPMTRYTPGLRSTATGLRGLDLLTVGVKLMLDPKQLLLIVLSIFVGLQPGFVGADYTAAFVSCAIGTGTVGYVMMTFGVADTFGCCVTAFLAKAMGRVRLICTAAAVNAATYMVLLTFRPHTDLNYVIYVIVVVLGMCNSVWLVQTNAYYGAVFQGKEEAAFSNFRLFEAIGYTISYSVSSYFRTSTKVYVLFIFMIIGVCGYFVVEYKEYKKKKGNDRIKEKYACEAY